MLHLSPKHKAADDQIVVDLIADGFDGLQDAVDGFEVKRDAQQVDDAGHGAPPALLGDVLGPLRQVVVQPVQQCLGQLLVGHVEGVLALAADVVACEQVNEAQHGAGDVALGVVQVGQKPADEFSQILVLDQLLNAVLRGGGDRRRRCGEAGGREDHDHCQNEADDFCGFFHGCLFSSFQLFS